MLAVLVYLPHGITRNGSSDRLTPACALRCRDRLTTHGTTDLFADRSSNALDMCGTLIVGL